MEMNLVEEGIKFMILGMGTVMVFLIMLIGLMVVQAKFIDKFFPEKSKVVSNNTPSTPKVSKTDDNKKIAAIIGAIQMYNQK